MQENLRFSIDIHTDVHNFSIIGVSVLFNPEKLISFTGKYPMHIPRELAESTLKEIERDLKYHREKIIEKLTAAISIHFKSKQRR